MDNKRTFAYIVQISLVLVVVMVLVSGGTFAYWQWASSTNKEVVFNTYSGYESYIDYDAGDSHFVGDFKKTSKFCQSTSTTISIKKNTTDVDFTITINMDINHIGASIMNSNNVYWIVTSGNKGISCSDGVAGLSDSSVINYGTFNGKASNSSFSLTPSLNVTTTKTEYTIWIWISNDTGLSVGETVDTNIWSQIDMLDVEENVAG